MTSTPATWDSLKQFVHSSLCEKENLIAEQFPLEITAIHRREQFCGIEFALFGPRNIRLTAIWSAEHSTLFFFDARGVRYASQLYPCALNSLPEVLRQHAA